MIRFVNRRRRKQLSQVLLLGLLLSIQLWGNVLAQGNELFVFNERILLSLSNLHKRSNSALVSAGSNYHLLYSVG